MIRWVVALSLLIGATSLFADGPVGNPLPDAIQPYRERAVEKWEKAMVWLEERNAAESHPDHSILFIGSSSIRRWETIVPDMAPFHPIQRGYGGARFSDVAVFAERLLHPHQFRAMVMFVGNDIAGKANDHSVDEVETLVKHILRVSRQHQPQAPIVLIEVTPTASRRQVWPQIQKMNSRLREIALQTPHVYFVPTAQHFLTPAGAPQDDLFVEDRLHLSQAGYELWAHLIRRRLNEVLRLEAATRAANAEVEAK